MSWLHDGVDALDTPGGHIGVLLVIFFSMVGMSAGQFGVPKLEDILIGTFGALVGKLSGHRSIRDLKNGTGSGKDKVPFK